jgi:uncharacterized protein
VARNSADRLNIAIVGTGIAGLSAAWLLHRRHTITVYESADRTGGHSHTVNVASSGVSLPVDMGFIVYNQHTYPNLSALFQHLNIPTKPAEMSFAVSLHDGALEYSGTDFAGLFAQKRNLLRPRFWAMIRDLVRFYRDGTSSARAGLGDEISLGDWLATYGYGDAFIRDHLLPMAAAIWSTPPEQMLAYPAAAFLQFCDNHGLLQLRDRPQWRTVSGGSRTYVKRLSHQFADRMQLSREVVAISRNEHGVTVTDKLGDAANFDHVVIAAHADQALRMLVDPSAPERDTLSALKYRANDVVMHRDVSLMPKRRSAWASWNYLGDDANRRVSATYWMNRLQSLPVSTPILVTINPLRCPADVIQRGVYAHPQFDVHALRAQQRLWQLQGVRRTWFCGAYFGAGFHEDGLQAGLAVAEALGGVERPWCISNPSDRIHAPPALQNAA